MSLYVEGPSSLTDAYGLRPDPQLYNEDLAPTTAEQRTWGTYNFIALWFSMSMEVTTYMLASSLIAGGMNWKQALGTILLGNLLEKIFERITGSEFSSTYRPYVNFCATVEERPFQGRVRMLLFTTPATSDATPAPSTSRARC